MKHYDEWTQEESEAQLEAIIAEWREYQALGYTPKEMLDIIADNKQLKKDNKDLISYKITISRLNGCNSCAIKNSCEYHPGLGKFERLNCYFWKDTKPVLNERSND